jgi:hypothetical protein
VRQGRLARFRLAASLYWAPPDRVVQAEFVHLPGQLAGALNRQNFDIAAGRSGQPQQSSASLVMMRSSGRLKATSAASITSDNPLRASSSPANQRACIEQDPTHTARDFRRVGRGRRTRAPSFASRARSSDAVNGPRFDS